MSLSLFFSMSFTAGNKGGLVEETCMYNSQHTAKFEFFRPDNWSRFCFVLLRKETEKHWLPATQKLIRTFLKKVSKHRVKGKEFQILAARWESYVRVSSTETTLTSPYLPRLLRI